LFSFSGSEFDFEFSTAQITLKCTLVSSCAVFCQSRRFNQCAVHVV